MITRNRPENTVHNLTWTLITRNRPENTVHNHTWTLIIRSRPALQTSGVIVQDSKFKYKIGKRVRFSQNITNENYIPKTKIIRSEIRKASKIEADNLKINSRDEILLIETTGKINNIPTILTKRTIPNKRFPSFLEIFQKELSVTQTLKLLGINDFVRSNTNIIAELADSIQANLLNCKINSPLLKTTYVNQDLNFIPIEYSQTWFVGERIQLTLED